jgi:hypothetical protein
LFVHCIVSVTQLARLAHYIDERSVLAVIHVLCHHTCYALDAQLVFAHYRETKQCASAADL